MRKHERRVHNVAMDKLHGEEIRLEGVPDQHRVLIDQSTEQILVHLLDGLDGGLWAVTGLPSSLTIELFHFQAAESSIAVDDTLLRPYQRFIHALQLAIHDGQSGQLQSTDLVANFPA